jgi:hypothetical protein
LLEGLKRRRRRQEKEKEKETREGEGEQSSSFDSLTDLFLGKDRILFCLLRWRLFVFCDRVYAGEKGLWASVRAQDTALHKIADTG